MAQPADRAEVGTPSLGGTFSLAGGRAATLPTQSYRTYAAGLYTHVRDRWGIVYDQPIVLDERQAGVAIEGIEQHNSAEDRIQISPLAVDPHGYTNPAMAIAKLLGFDLCPRLRDLAERKLFVPRGFSVLNGLEAVTES